MYSFNLRLVNYVDIGFPFYRLRNDKKKTEKKEKNFVERGKKK